MSNKTITQLPTVASSDLTDIIYAVTDYVSPSDPGTSVQQTLQQLFNLISDGIIQSYPGNPNGNVAGATNNFCWDTANRNLYICTTTGASSTAVWTLTAANLITPAQGGTGVSNPTAHRIPVSEGSGNFTFLPLTNMQVLLGVTGSDPTPVTVTAGTGIDIVAAGGNLTFTNTATGGVVSPAFGGTGVSNPTAHGIAVAEGASDFTFLPLSDMQVLLGNSAADPTPVTVTAGTGIDIVAAGGNLTFTNTATGGLTFPAFGGTGVSNPTAHGIAVAEGADNFTFLPLSDMQVLLGNSGADPTPVTVAAGTGISIVSSGGNLTFTNTATGGVVSPAFGGTGVSNPTAHAIPIAEGSSNYNFISLTNMQVLLGVTSANPTPVTVTPGVGMSIVSSGGNLIFSATGAGGFSWNRVTSSTQAMLSNNGYVSDSGSLVLLTLPTTSNFGDEISIVGKGSGGWSIFQGIGQQVIIGSVSSSSGGGSVTSTNSHDSIYLVCTVANTIWTSVGAPQGNLAIV